MKKALKIVWRLIPWYLAFRDIYIFGGMMFNRIRSTTKTESLNEYNKTNDIDSYTSDLGSAANTMIARYRAGWKLALKK